MILAAASIWVPYRYSHRGDFTLWSCCLENGRTTTLALGKRHVVPSVHNFSQRGRYGVLVQLLFCKARTQVGFAAGNKRCGGCSEAGSIRPVVVVGDGITVLGMRLPWEEALSNE